MKSEEAFAAEQAVEAKLAETGAGDIRRHSFGEAPEAAPEPGTPAEDQPRNELGQFTSPEQEQQPPEEESQTVEETVEADAATQDPAVQTLLNKYGSVDKALEAAVHAQRKLGQQSTEVGELRRAVEELTALRETVQADYQSRTSQPTPLDQATVDWFDQQMIERPQQAIEWAQQQNNPLLVQRGLDVWKEVDPYGAAVYTARVENQQMVAQLQQQVTKQQQLPVDATVNLALQNVRNRNPQFANYDDAIQATLQNHPFAAKALEAAAATGDATQIEGAIETLYSLAVGDTLRTLALTGDTPETDTTTEQVVVPTVSETREPAAAPSAIDQFRDMFRQESDRVRKGVWVAE